MFEQARTELYNNYITWLSTTAFVLSIVLFGVAYVASEYRWRHGSTSTRLNTSQERMTVSLAISATCTLFLAVIPTIINRCEFPLSASIVFVLSILVDYATDWPRWIGMLCFVLSNTNPACNLIILLVRFYFADALKTYSLTVESIEHVNWVQNHSSNATRRDLH